MFFWDLYFASCLSILRSSIRPSSLLQKLEKEVNIVLVLQSTLIMVKFLSDILKKSNFRITNLRLLKNFMNVRIVFFESYKDRFGTCLTFNSLCCKFWVDREVGDSVLNSLKLYVGQFEYLKHAGSWTYAILGKILWEKKGRIQ